MRIFRACSELFNYGMKASMKSAPDNLSSKMKFLLASLLSRKPSTLSNSVWV